MNNPALAPIPEEVVLTEAWYLGGHRIAFEFSDGCSRIVDFYPFLARLNQNPMVSKYLDVEKFKSFRILHGTDISWNEYEMCFRMEDLYHDTL